jgi:hypothetical protein
MNIIPIDVLVDEDKLDHCIGVLGHYTDSPVEPQDIHEKLDELDRLRRLFAKRFDGDFGVDVEFKQDPTNLRVAKLDIWLTPKLLGMCLRPRATR